MEKTGQIQLSHSRLSILGQPSRSSVVYEINFESFGDDWAFIQRIAKSLWNIELTLKLS
jgi:hypothetical protein